MQWWEEPGRVDQVLDKFVNYAYTSKTYNKFNKQPGDDRKKTDKKKDGKYCVHDYGLWHDIRTFGKVKKRKIMFVKWRKTAKK